MTVKPIRNEEDYEAALAEAEALMQVEPGSPEGDRLELLSMLIEAYEDKHYSLPNPDPIEAIHYHLESRGLNEGDLEPYLGNQERVSAVLKREYPLTLEMIRRLHEGLGISADVLIQSYETVGKAA